ncbi:protein TIFY 5A isoform X1 [Capsella rubella]|nr:protein TIFY 5A isoform X1 [Capsella rubella]
MKTMQQTCDLELRLSPTSTYDYSSSENTSSVIESSISGDHQVQPKEESQRLTIFYNGKMCVSSNVTHLQAKSIISMANRSNGSDPSNESTRFHHNHYDHQLPNPKASMKRSLQSFLQKRKIRIQAASSPYHHHHSRR